MNNRKLHSTPFKTTIIINNHESFTIMTNYYKANKLGDQENYKSKTKAIKIRNQSFHFFISNKERLN